MAVELESTYPTGGVRWVRGNLHTHSTRSDGRRTVQEMVGRYAGMGYGFLVMSDHDVLSEYGGIDPCGMVLISGNEVSGGGPHVLDVGAKVLVKGRREQQGVIDEINERSGFAILNHPNWENDFNHYPYELLATLSGYVGVEIFNGLVIEQAGFHLATDKWDRLLSAGKKVWGFANDDAHDVGHIGRGWNVVALREGEEVSEESIVRALREGRFYASSGVGIERIESEGAVLRVVAPEAGRMAAYGTFGRQVFVCEGGEMVLDTAGLDVPYVRVECYGDAGAQAWTQPVWIRGGLYEERERELARVGALGKSVLRVLESEVGPVVTGGMSDPLWERAEAFGGFKSLKDGTASPVRTEVRAIRAGGELFIGVRCEEPEMGKVEWGPNSAIWAIDSVELFLDPDGKGLGCWQVMVSAGGQVEVVGKGAVSGETPGVRGMVGRSEKGWSVEVVVPVGRVEKGTRWGFHVCRNRCPVRGNYVWSWVGNSNHNRAEYGSLIM